MPAYVGYETPKKNRVAILEPSCLRKGTKNNKKNIGTHSRARGTLHPPPET